MTLAVVILPHAGCSEGVAPPVGTVSPAVQTTPTWASQAAATVPADVKSQASQVLRSGELVTDHRRVTFTPTGQPLLRITTFDPADQSTRKLVLNSSGAEVDLAAMIKQAEANHRAKYGALAEALYTKVKASPTAEVKVKVEYAVNLPLKQKQHDMTKYRTAVKAAVAKAAGPVAAAWQKVGGTVVWQSTSAPIMHVRAQGSVITAARDIPGMLHVKQYQPFTPVHHAATSTTDLNIPTVFYGNSQFGEGVAVGISGEEAVGNCKLSPHGFYAFGQVQGGNVNYSTTAQTSCNVHADCWKCDTTAGDGVCRNGVCVVQHGTLVAGMVGHLASLLFPRQAPLVDLYFNNNSSWTHGAQLQWFYNNGVSVENESWGGAPDTFNQDYYPIIGMAITEAPGNGGAGDVSSCAANAICVGGYRDLMNLYDGTSSANPVDCSRWLSGTACDLELPHVTFHGENVITTSALLPADSMETRPGTSLSAPAAAGLLALMVQRWPLIYEVWPEATRAAMMASADSDVHQIASTQQCPTTNKTYSDYRCPDERDGAGVPNASRLEEMASNGYVRKETLYRDSSFDANGKYIFGSDVYLQVGDRLRAVLSWDVCPTTSILPTHANGVHADLDLHILNDGGYRVANGASYDGGYEIVEIVATTAGNYRFEVQKFGWQDCTQLGSGSMAKVYIALALDVR